MKIALITGASRGLGRDAAISLAKKGVQIIFTYNSNKEAALATIKEIEDLGQKSFALKLDTGDSSSFKEFTNVFKELLKNEFNRESFDYLLNNAGVGLYKKIEDMKEDDLDMLYNIHLKGVYFLTQKLIPHLEDGASILNVSSGLTRFSYPTSSAYACLKGAVEVLTRYLAVELGPKKIRVNCIAPGAIETDFGEGRVRDNPELNKMIAGNTPLGRVGRPSDIGGIMAELLSGEMSWVNGQRIEASGGIHS